MALFYYKNIIQSVTKSIFYCCLQMYERTGVCGDYLVTKKQKERKKKKQKEMLSRCHELIKQQKRKKNNKK